MRKFLFLALAALLAAPAVASAGEAIGYVKVLTGSATVVRANGERSLSIGAPIYEADVLRTAAESTLGVTMKDGTTVSAGPETEIFLDEYAWAPKQNEMGFAARVSQGTINFVSGMLGKLAPESVTVETPTGVIGLRGTHFVVRVEPGQKLPEAWGQTRGSRES